MVIEMKAVVRIQHIFFIGNYKNIFPTAVIFGQATDGGFVVVRIIMLHISQSVNSN